MILTTKVVESAIYTNRIYVLQWAVWSKHVGIEKITNVFMSLYGVITFTKVMKYYKNEIK